MADKITTTKELKVVAKFTDQDTRTLTLDNPKSDLTAEQINAVAAIAKESNFLIGDKAGAPFLQFEIAKVVEKETTHLDLR